MAHAGGVFFGGHGLSDDLCECLWLATDRVGAYATERCAARRAGKMPVRKGTLASRPTRLAQTQAECLFLKRLATARNSATSADDFMRELDDTRGKGVKLFTAAVLEARCRALYAAHDNLDEPTHSGWNKRSWAAEAARLRNSGHCIHTPPAPRARRDLMEHPMLVRNETPAGHEVTATACVHGGGSGSAGTESDSNESASFSDLNSSDESEQ